MASRNGGKPTVRILRGRGHLRLARCVAESTVQEQRHESRSDALGMKVVVIQHSWTSDTRPHNLNRQGCFLRTTRGII